MAVEYFVDQSSPTNGVGSYADPFNSVNGAALVRNATYRFNGIYRGSLVLNTALDSDKLIYITSYGENQCEFNSRIRITGTWTNLGGGIWSINLTPNTPVVFWAGFENETVECAKDTTTPTTPAEKKWGVSGTTLYWHPAEDYPVPGDTGATFEYNISSRLSGVEVVSGYVDLSYIDALHSAYHGIQISGPSTINHVYGRFLNAAFNGNQTFNGPRIGNGIAVMYNTDGIEFYRCSMHHNIDHGGNAEGLSGTSPRPKNVLFDWCNSYSNGSRGYAFSSSDVTYPLRNINVFRGEVYSNGTAVAFIPETTPVGNGETGVSFNRSQGSVKRVHIHHNAGAGIWINGVCYDGINGVNYELDSNIIHNNNTDLTNTIPGDAGGISIHRQNSEANGGVKGKIYIRNNTCFDNGANNIHLYYSPFNGSIEISNNVIYGATSRDVFIEGSLGTDSGIISNMLQSVAVRIGGVSYTSIDALNATAFADGNYIGTPMYIDAANGDYRPAHGSPVIGGGVNNGITADKEGQPVPNFSGQRAVGAHEYYEPKDGFGPWAPFDGTLPALTTEPGFALTRVVVSSGPLTANQIRKNVVEDL